MKTLLDEIKEQKLCYKYISFTGKTCYRTYGDLSWYLLKCKQYGLQPKQKGDFYHTAKGDGFEFDYCEHDIVYAEDLAL
jgi:hypothetical protein